ncbi:MAG: hypothetical protein LC796_00455 [Acidobacteria bacterium]|nr:hypothetical protein [Acidobacteriota bacterium]MCA1609472.1 hypothetical protein [Acidobacteriota bacterium]
MKLHREKMLLFAGLGLGLALGGARVASASGYAPWSVTVLVDGSPAPEYSARGRIYIEALKGRTFSVRLSNPTSERVAVALSVDGRNVIDAKRTSAGKATKWILMPGQTADIPGWQISGETSRRFFFTETRRSYAQWLGDTSNAGTIEAVFFRERRPAVAVPIAPRRRQRDRVDLPSDERAVEGGIEGGMPADPSATNESAGSRSESTVSGEAPVLDSRSAKMSRDKPGARPPAKDRESDSFAATGIGDRTPFAVQWISFDEDPVPAARIAVRYEFRAELVRLGVFPREDELYARDRGRGFEREYAPDPHRDR